MLVIVISFALMILLQIMRAIDIRSGAEANLDVSWYMSLIALHRDGTVAGRDFLFTHGPLSQLMISLGGYLNTSGNAFDAYTLARMGDGIFGSALLCLVVSQIRPGSWKFTLYILIAIATLNMTSYYRPYQLLLGAILVTRAVSAPALWQRLVYGASVGVWAVAAHLFTFDQGIYVIFSASVMLLGLAGLSRLKAANKELLPTRQYLYIFLSCWLAYILGNLLIDLYFTLTSANYQGFFDYQLQSLEVIRSFVYTLGLEWQLSWMATLILFLICSYLIVFLFLNFNKFPRQDSILLLSMLIFGLPMLKGAVGRSDPGHIIYNATPIIFLFLVMGYDWLKSGKIKIIWVGLVLMLVFFWPNTDLTAFQDVGSVLDSKPGLFDRFYQYQQQKTPLEDIVPEGMAEAVGSGKNLLSFPYDNYLVLGLKRKLVAPILQPYAAGTIPLQQAYVAELERQKNQVEVIYALDDMGVDRLDNVQNITRNPLIFEYLYRNFELKQPQFFGKGYLLLAPRLQARPPLSGIKLNFKGLFDNSRLPLSYQLTDPAACSLMKLNLKIQYPLTALVGRPEGFKLKLFSGKTEILTTDLVPLATGEEFSTLIQLVEPAGLSSIFGTGVVRSQRWDRLELQTRATGLFGVSADKVELRNIECINFGQPALSEQDLKFNPGDTSLWQARNMITAEAVGDKAANWSVGNDPQLQFLPPLNICRADYSYLYLKMSASTDIVARQATFYFRINGQSAFNENQAITLPLAKDGELEEYFIDLNYLKLDKTARFTGLRFDPVYEGIPDGKNRVVIADFRFIANPNSKTTCNP